MDEETGWHYFVFDSSVQAGNHPATFSVFTSMDRAKQAANPGQEIWRGPWVGGTLEFVEAVGREGSESGT
jgi:hypothetical protein